MFPDRIQEAFLHGPLSGNSKESFFHLTLTVMTPHMNTTWGIGDAMHIK